VAAIGPTNRSTAAPDAGRVVLALDGPGPHAAAVATAFGAAHRRRTDLCVVHGFGEDQALDPGGRTFRSLLRWHGRFPDVPVRESLMTAPFAATLGPLATGAALLVVTTRTSTARRPWTWSTLPRHATQLLGGLTDAPVLFVPDPRPIVAARPAGPAA
jgi:hypothetical protein